MAAPEDVNVDELRRRARRRLVGAIVLALAVAVFVPMLLESDPKPLGEDVSVKIPPIDEGKFVNRLNDKGKIETAKPAAPPPKVEPKAEAPKAAEPAPAEPAKTEVAKAEPSKVESTAPAPAPALATVTESPKAAPPVSLAPAPREPASGDFSVQLAAFSDDKGANALANRLKKAGYPAYTEPLSTSRGTLWRVRVGPYSSRESAVASREKLKGDGYSGIVAAAK